ncbi:amino acid ABC transporter permease [Paenarthrobacter sp. S56]|uniref:amino acid ABC transporter permease n=1 Tax=Paenarthrobacter sp. S56 TaxID=3138179 RepID=UPI00321BC541
MRPSTDMTDARSSTSATYAHGLHEQSDDGLKVVPLRHPGRWVAGAAAATVLLAVAGSLAGNPNLDSPSVLQYLFHPSIMKGLWTTVWLTVAAMVLGLLGGTLIAVMRLSPNPVLHRIAAGYIWFFRGTPLLVQIIFWGFLGALYPTLSVGIPLTDITFAQVSTSAVIGATAASLIALTTNEAAYAAEIVRAGILSVDAGQSEAAIALGLSNAQSTFRVVLPQAMRVIVPPLGNETITMLKSTSLVSVIGGADLLSNAQSIYAQNFKVIPLLVVVAFWFLALTSVLTICQGFLERRFGRGTVQRSSKRRVRKPASRPSPANVDLLKEEHQ